VCYLVGSFNPSEKYESLLGYIWENNPNIPNHQPDRGSNYSNPAKRCQKYPKVSNQAGSYFDDGFFGRFTSSLAKDQASNSGQPRTGAKGISCSPTDSLRIQCREDHQNPWEKWMENFDPKLETYL
jgi:hypothetical protein